MSLKGISDAMLQWAISHTPLILTLGSYIPSNTVLHLFGAYSGTVPGDDQSGRRAGNYSVQ